MTATYTNSPQYDTLNDAVSLGTRRCHLTYSHISRATATPIGTKNNTLSLQPWGSKELSRGFSPATI